MSLAVLQPRRDVDVYRGVTPSPLLSAPVLRLAGHLDAVNEVKFNPDGSLLATCASELILWSVTAQINSVGSLRPHKSAITSVAFSNDRSRFCTASADKTIAVQDIQTGQIIRRFKSHREIVNAVSFLNEPDLLVSGGDDCQIIIHDCRQRNPVGKLRSNSPVTSISISSAFIAVGGVCGSVFVDSYELKMIYRMNHNDMIFGVALDRNDRFLAVNDSSGKLSFFDVQTCFPSNDRTLSEVQNGIPRQDVVPCRVSISADRRFVACGSTDEVLRVWDIENLHDPLLAKEIHSHKGTVTGVDFHPKCGILASGGMDGIVFVRDLGTLTG